MGGSQVPQRKPGDVRPMDEQTARTTTTRTTSSTILDDFLYFLYDFGQLPLQYDINWQADMQTFPSEGACWSVCSMLAYVTVVWSS